MALLRGRAQPPTVAAVGILVIHGREDVNGSDLVICGKHSGHGLRVQGENGRVLR